MGCSTGLGTAKNEGLDAVLPPVGKANVDFVVAEVVLAVVTGVGWLVGNENVGAGVAVGFEVLVVGGARVGGLVKKLDATVLAAIVEGSGFEVEVGMVVVAGLAKMLGTAGCVGAGTEAEDAGTGVGVENKFLAGSLVSVVVVTSVVGFGCEGAARVGVNKLGVVAVIEGVVAGLNETAGAGGGFFSSSVTFWS